MNANRNLVHKTMMVTHEQPHKGVKTATKKKHKKER